MNKRVGGERQRRGEERRGEERRGERNRAAVGFGIWVGVGVGMAHLHLGHHVVHLGARHAVDLGRKGFARHRLLRRHGGGSGGAAGDDATTAGVRADNGEARASLGRCRAASLSWVSGAVLDPCCVLCLVAGTKWDGMGWPRDEQRLVKWGEDVPDENIPVRSGATPSPEI